MIQSKFPQQLPMLTGDGAHLVFGDKQEYQPYTVVVVDVAEGQEIILDAGLAAGLSCGTRFAIYSNVNHSDKKIAIACAGVARSRLWFS